MLEQHRMKAEFPAEDRNDLDLCQQPVYVGVGNFDWPLKAMDCKIEHFDLQTERNGVEISQVNAAAGNSLQFCNQAVPHPDLKRICGHVPGCEREKQQAAKQDGQQIFPDLATRSAFAHRA